MGCKMPWWAGSENPPPDKDKIISDLRAQLTTLQAKLEAAEKDAVIKLTQAIYAEAGTWKGDNRGAVFLALSGLANRMGISLSKNDLWDAAIDAAIAASKED